MCPLSMRERGGKRGLVFVRRNEKNTTRTRTTRRRRGGGGGGRGREWDTMNVGGKEQSFHSRSRCPHLQLVDDRDARWNVGYD